MAYYDEKRQTQQVKILLLLYLYPKEYEEKFGVKGYQEEVDKALDGINEMRKKIAEDEE